MFVRGAQPGDKLEGRALITESEKPKFNDWQLDFLRYPNRPSRAHNIIVWLKPNMQTTVWLE